MNPKFAKFVCLLVFVMMGLSAMAQNATTVTTDVVPHLINYSGLLKDIDGKTLNSISGVTFLIYKDEQGGTPLWSEIQNVQPDDSGAYSVQLGATKPEGVPPEVFATGEARWLGVQVEGQGEQARVLLVSVPYALKAKDAETLGGRPASAYMLAPATSEPSPNSTPPEASAASASALPYAGLNIVSKKVSSSSIGGGGAAGYLPVWTDASDLGNSSFFQNSSGQVGLGTTSPVSALTMNGTLAFTNASTPLLYGYSNGAKGVLFGSRMLWSLSPQSPNYGIFFSPTVGSATRMIWQTSPTQQFLSADFTNQRLGVGTANPAATLDVFADGIDTLVGNMGCSSMFFNTAGLAFGYSTTKLNCTTYSLLGDSYNTYINAPPYNSTFNFGGNIEFSEGNVPLFQMQQLQGWEGFIQYALSAGNGDQAILFDNTDYINNPDPDAFSAVFGDDRCGDEYFGLSLIDNFLSYAYYNFFCSSYALLTDVDTGDVYLNSAQGPNLHLRVGNAEIATASALDGGLDATFNVNGTLTKQGGSFKIDHPLDPANKYLYHSFVESPDMKNIYDGVVNLDDQGEATVPLPEWFGKLNRDFRYQLTSIGAPGPNLYIAEEVTDNQFKIAGGAPGAKISWQVTGIRQDEWANAHRIPVEEEKEGVERGHYLHPELFGQPEQASIQWAHEPNMRHAKKGDGPRKGMQPRPASRPGLPQGTQP